MNQALLRLWDVCIFRAGPQDLPNSFYLLLLLIAGSYVIDLMLMRLIVSELVALWYLRPGVWVAIFAIAIYSMLLFREVPQRFLRTFIALVGTGLYLSSIALILCTFLQEIQGVFILAVLVWQIVIHGRVIAIAIHTKLLIGTLITIVLIFVIDQIATLLLQLSNMGS